MGQRRFAFNLAIMIMGITISASLLVGCSEKQVTPYNEKLATSTEEFYKETVAVINEGRAVSPTTNVMRKKITNPKVNNAYYSKFEKKYTKLITDSEVIILHAMSNDDVVDMTDTENQSMLGELADINLTLPRCVAIRKEMGKAGFSESNYINLKCLLVSWRDEHANPRYTENTLILKKANWDGRKKQLFNVILAIRKSSTTEER